MPDTTSAHRSADPPVNQAPQFCGVTLLSGRATAVLPSSDKKPKLETTNVAPAAEFSQRGITPKEPRLG